MRSSSPDGIEPDGIAVGAEEKAAFHLRLRARGLRAHAVLRAMELVPRKVFVPHHYLDLATRDLALPIGCGQTLNEPWLTGRMIEALAVERTHRVLQIGAGSGYATAILAYLCADVIGLERFQSLAVAAQSRLVDLGLANAAVAWGDGLAVPAQIEPFDRIIVHGVLPEVPEVLMDRLLPDGLLVAARPNLSGQSVMRHTKLGTATAICPCRLQPLVSGLAAL